MSACGNGCAWCPRCGWVGLCCGECGRGCPSPVYVRKNVNDRGEFMIGDILDAMVFKSMTTKQLVEHIHIALMGPAEDDTKPLERGQMRRRATRKHVEAYIEGLVQKYGHVGDVTRNRLVALTMKQVERRQRKQSNTDWSYIRTRGN